MQTPETTTNTQKSVPPFFKKQTNNKQIKTSKRHSIALIVMGSLSLFALLMFGILSLIMVFNTHPTYHSYENTRQPSQTILIIWNVIANFILLTYFINMVMCVSIGLQRKKLYPMMNLQSIWLLILLSCLGSFGALIIGMNIFITMRMYNKLNTLVEVSKTQTLSL